MARAYAITPHERLSHESITPSLWSHSIKTEPAAEVQNRAGIVISDIKQQFSKNRHSPIDDQLSFVVLKY
jgi:hypothetical protein